MDIKYQCAKCGNSSEPNGESGGKRLRCASCNSVMEIPAKNAMGVSIVKVYSASGKSKKRNDIVFRCKLCNKKYRLSKDFAGIEAECAKCKKILVVPRHSDTSDESLQDKIIFRCHECSQKYRLPKIYANQKAKCSRCHSFFIIPEQSEVTQPIPSQGKAPETQKAEARNSSAEKIPAAQERIPAQSAMNTDAQNIREEMSIRNSRTQTSVEIAGDSAMLVKYVLVPPGRNIFKDTFYCIKHIFSRPQR